MGEVLPDFHRAELVPALPLRAEGPPEDNPLFHTFPDVAADRAVSDLLRWVSLLENAVPVRHRCFDSFQNVDTSENNIKKTSGCLGW